jgi:aspartyl protease family protein
MVRVLIVALVMLGAGVVAVRMIDQKSRAPATANAMAVEREQPTPAPANARSLVIKSNDSGHFAVDARIDGRRIGFMVDTGASQITIRESDAARLGFHPARRDYSVKISTANGEGRAAIVDLRMVEVGDIVVRDLRALVVPDEALSVNLLGMSFLSRVRWTHERGRLTLEQ